MLKDSIIFWKSQNGSLQNSPPHFFSEGLTGFEGSYYFNARWYDAGTGRFVTEDPIRDGLLWYAYAAGNPLRYIDPTGLEKKDFYMLVIRGRTPAESFEKPTDTGKDYIVLVTDDGNFTYEGFQASATELTPEGNNDSVKSGSQVTFTMKYDSNKSYGKSIVMSGGETIDGRSIDENGIPEGSSARNSVHGNSPEGREEREYDGGVLKSQGCANGEVESYEDLLEKLEELGVEEDDTWDGGVLDEDEQGA